VKNDGVSLLLKTGLIKSFYKNARYNDEPLVYQYTAIAKKGFRKGAGGGMSFNRIHAQTKALGEAIERLCLGCFSPTKIVYSNASALIGSFLDPRFVVSVSETQKKLKKYHGFIFNTNSKFGWIKGSSIKTKKPVWIPAQLVYVPYKYNPKEPVIRFPISTGAALGNSLETALYRGLCEVIERDAFMIYYLNRLKAKQIDLDSENSLKDIRHLFQRYKLDIRVYDITTDISVPVAMCLIMDQTGFGPSLSIGLKCSLSLYEAVIGSIEEAQHTRPWMRDEIAKANKKGLDKLKNNSTLIIDPKTRGLFWYKGELAKTLNFWISSRTDKIKLEAYPIEEKSNVKLKDVIDRLLSKKYESYFVDITVPEVKKLGLFAVKAIVPRLQPLYLDEGYPYLGGERLHNVAKILGIGPEKRELNNIPHPFL